MNFGFGIVVDKGRKMRKFRSLIITCFVIIVAFPGKSPGMANEEIIKTGEMLNLDRCIEIALVRQPSIVASFYTVEASRSRIGEAQSNYYPQITASGGYNRVKSLGTATTANGGVAFVGSSVSFDQYSSSVSLSQNIYDFGKTSSQVRIQKFNFDSAGCDLETTKDQIVLSVKQAYYTLVQAIRNRAVAQESVGQYQQHLEQSRGFYEVGTKPKYDVITAEVNLSNSKLSLITADNNLKIAKVNLNNAMGVPDAPAYTVEDTLAFSKYEITLDDALARAMEHRPDLLSLAMKTKAAQENVAFTRTGYYPALTGSATYSWEGVRLSSLENGWNAGVSLSFPIFSGFLTKHQVAEADSNLKVAQANEQVLRENVVLDVQQSYLNLKQAEDSIATADLAVKQATENLDIVNGRYAAGVGNPVEVTDAQVTYSNAKLAYIQAVTNYNVARASLLKAMGER
jgi:outer membrane protein